MLGLIIDVLLPYSSSVRFQIRKKIPISYEFQNRCLTMTSKTLRILHLLSSLSADGSQHLLRLGTDYLELLYVNQV